MKYSPDIFEIGALIYDRVNADIPVFPVVAENGCTLPFALYRRTGLREDRTKEGYVVGAVATVEVCVMAATYADSLELAARVKSKLEGLRGRWRTLLIEHTAIVNADEDWNADAYAQRLWVEIHISDLQ